MTRNLKRAGAFASAALTAISLSVAGAGTAGASDSIYWGFGNRYYCHTQDYFNAGIVHVSEATGACSWLYPGNGVRSNHGGTSKVIVANVILPNGSHTVAFVDDPTGLYPTK